MKWCIIAASCCFFVLGCATNGTGPSENDIGADGAKGDKGAKGDTGDPGKDFDDDTYREALAAAASLHIPTLDSDKKFGFGPGVGIYDDQFAFSLNGAARIDKTWQFGGSVGISTEGGEISGKAAIIGQW